MKAPAPILIALVATLTLIPSARAAAGSLEAHTDRTTLRQGETTTLLLRHRGADVARPDLGPLTADFDVLETREVSRTSIVNGRRDESHDFMVTLAPRRTGELTVPAITLGDERSAPIKLTVTEAGAPDADGPAPDSPVLIEVSVDTETPYVQGKVTLTARLYADASVRRGAIGAPEPDGALVEAVGEDRTWDTTLGGKPYRVIERDYALFPQRSGPLTIPPVTFEGSVADGRRRSRSPFDAFDDGFGAGFSGGFGAGFGGSLFGELFDSGRPIRVASPSLTLDVRAKPDVAAADWWLPARQVILVEEWQPEPPVFRVGEQVTRTVAVQALGLSGSQLPVPTPPDVVGLRQYADPPVDDTVPLGDEIAAVKAQRVAMIPTRPGSLTLPAIEIAWWDTVADTQRVASLPARIVEVLPGDGSAAQAGPLAAAPPTDGAGKPETTPPQDPSPQDGPSPSFLSSNPVTSTLIGGVGLLLLVAVGARLRRRSTQLADSAPEQAPPRLGNAERALHRSCRANDPVAASAALGVVCRARWPDAVMPSASALAARLDDEHLTRRVEELNRVLYAPADQSWNGGALWAAYLVARRAKVVDRGRPGALPAMYPSGTA